MLDLVLFVFLLAGLWVALRRSRAVRGLNGPHAAVSGLWLGSWAALVISALLLTSREAFPDLASGGLLLRALFAWGTLSGAWVLTTSELPRPWVVPFGAALGVVGAGAAWWGAEAFASWVAFAAEAPPLLAAAFLLRAGAPPQTLWSRALAPLLVGMAGVMAAPHLVSGWQPESQPVLAAALVVTPALFAAQLRSVADANRERLRRERDVLERRFTARTQELAAANHSLLREVERHEGTEAALRESERRHRLVSELSSDFGFEVLVDRDRGLELEWVSGSFERITGRPADALSGWGFVSLLVADQQLETEEMVTQFEGGRTAEIEREIHTPDGDTRLLKIRVVSIEEAGGSLRVVGGARDVTEARRAQRERLALEHQLQDAQRIESLGVLTGGIAHDFNNLLSVILGNLRLASEDTPSASVRARLGKARTAAEHAARLTEQMLAYSGKASMTLVPTDLSALALEMEDLLAAALPEGARLELTVDPRAIVDADSTRLRQVLLNLVVNAGESLPDGRGNVGVRVRVDDGEAADAVGWFGDVPAGAGVVLEVLDDGCGMDAELQRRIFDPFFTTKFSGRGLGLASVLGIVRSHGGAIRADSEPKQGTTLCVRLSRSAGEPAPAVPPLPKVWGMGHVLVIDDDESVLELAEEFLVRTGHTVVTASGGRSGIARFREASDEIDVVVLDLGMPDLDGGEVLDALCRIQPGVRVVLSTGYQEESAAERFGARGVVAVLGKPYEPEELVDAVARACSDGPD